ncbi:acetyltransferase [alpha proteobacterium U9-1i]|nr:acetyltransferase [alpha proteobacterium U9-1i]
MATRFVTEKPEHAEAIELVLDRAFGPGRLAKTSERVRERGAVAEPLLSRVALSDAGDVIGVCRIWSVRAEAPVYFLGPLAVDPGAQHGGLGAELTRQCVEACRAARAAGGIVLVGAEQFFRPLGFSRVPDGRIAMPGPTDANRLLWQALRPGGLDQVKGELRGR